MRVTKSTICRIRLISVNECWERTNIVESELITLAFFYVKIYVEMLII